MMSDESDFDVPAELYEVTERHAKLKSDLRELIGEFREKAQDADSDVQGNAEYRVYHECANALSDVINDDE